MRLALIGVGLIGGSLAAALKAAGEVDHVVGFDIDPRATAKGVAAGVIDRAADSMAEAVSSVDVLILAIPVGAMREAMAGIAKHLPPQALVTDVGSTKVSVIADARATLGANARASSTPMRDYSRVDLRSRLRRQTRIAQRWTRSNDSGEVPVHAWSASRPMFMTASSQRSATCHTCLHSRWSR
jgi:Prephenate dehydrogenase